MRRAKVGLDLLWLRDEGLEDSANLPDPDVINLEIPNDLEAALKQFASIASDLSVSSAGERVKARGEGVGRYPARSTRTAIYVLSTRCCTRA